MPCCAASLVFGFLRCFPPSLPHRREATSPEGPYSFSCERDERGWGPLRSSAFQPLRLLLFPSPLSPSPGKEVRVVWLLPPLVLKGKQRTVGRRSSQFSGCLFACLGRRIFDMVDGGAGCTFLLSSLFLKDCTFLAGIIGLKISWPGFGRPYFVGHCCSGLLSPPGIFTQEISKLHIL